MISGSCLCGSVKYRINGRLFDALNCHCSMCRKAHGAAFRSRATLKAADFEWVQGEGCLTFYESSPGNHRGFCRVCGSPIVSKFDATQTILACRSARWTTIRESDRRSTCTSPARRPGLRSPTICRRFLAKRPRRPSTIDRLPPLLTVGYEISIHQRPRTFLHSPGNGRPRSLRRQRHSAVIPPKSRSRCAWRYRLRASNAGGSDATRFPAPWSIEELAEYFTSATPAGRRWAISISTRSRAGGR